MAKWTKTSYDEEDMEKKLLRPFSYLLPLRVYGLVAYKLPEAFNYWLRIPQEKLESIRKVVVKLNNAFAIQDDVQDEAQYRRTQPSAHRVFGNALAINSFVHLYFLALQDVIELGHPKAVEIFSRCLLMYIRGAGAGIYWREYQCDISHDDYNQMAINQTGCEMILIMEMMQLFSDDKRDYEYIVKLFSLYYQLRDEYVDLMKPEAVEEGARLKELQKLSTITFCEDFSEGKISTPVIHAMKGPHRDVILSLLKTRPRDIQGKEFLLSLIEESGGIEKTRELLKELEADMFAEIRRLGGNPVFENFLLDFQTWDERA